MQVKVTRDFRAVKPGHIYPSDIRKGEIVDGRLAEIAIEKKCCDLAAPPVQELSASDPVADPQPDAQAITAAVDALVAPDAPVSAIAVEPPVSAPAEKVVALASKPATPPPIPAAPAKVVTPTKPAVQNIVVRARLKDRYDGPDDKGKQIKLAKGAVVSAPLAQMLVDKGLAVVVETRAAQSAPETR